ncbi:hypothetical protein B7463_g11631, partial [Scytalidium lignicola]
MSSSQGAQSQGSILASIPFAKFSHTSNPPEAVKFTWNHVGRSDLDFIIHSSRIALDDGTYENRRVMKITAGADILVRRVQLKFRNDADFADALNLMKSLGFHITQSPPIKSTVVRSSLTDVVDSSSANFSATQQSALQSKTNGINRWTTHSSNAPTQSSTLSQLAVPERPYSVDSSMLGRSSLPSIGTSRPSEHLTRPSTANSHSLGRTHSLSYTESLHSSHTDCVSQPKIATDHQPPHSQSQHLLAQTSNQVSIPPHSLDEASVFTNAIDSAYSRSTSIRNGDIPVELSSHTLSSASCEPSRSASTPAYSTDINSLNIPPKRALPFARPHTAAPMIVCELGQNPVNGIQTRSGSNIQEEEISPLAAKTLTSMPPSASSGLQSKEMTTRKRNNTSSNGRQPAAKRSKMSSQGTQTQTLSGRDHTTGMGRATGNEVADNGTGRCSEVTPILSDYLQHLLAFLTQDKTPSPPKEIWEIPGYADADEEARETILNDFICANLENTDFRKLCEDTELAWRRVGLVSFICRRWISLTLEDMSQMTSAVGANNLSS